MAWQGARQPGKELNPTVSEAEAFFTHAAFGASRFGVFRCSKNQTTRSRAGPGFRPIHDTATVSCEVDTGQSCNPSGSTAYKQMLSWEGLAAPGDGLTLKFT